MYFMNVLEVSVTVSRPSAKIHSARTTYISNEICLPKNSAEDIAAMADGL